MIELGKIQKLEVVRFSDFGVYLDAVEDEYKEAENEILLPNKQVPMDAKLGDLIEVFVYKDTSDRPIATTIIPKLTVGKVAILEVVEETKIGAFLDWGLQKDLLLPFTEQLGRVKKGEKVIVSAYVDKSERLCATMKVYNALNSHSPFEVNQVKKGLVYKIDPEYGVFVAVDYQYHGMIPLREIFGNPQVGDEVEVRIKKVRKEDGKLELSMRKQLVQQIEIDAKKIMVALEKNNGKLALNDKSAPALIKSKMGMSKASFKRAIGRLLKEGAINITSDGIERRW